MDGTWNVGKGLDPVAQERPQCDMDLESPVQRAAFRWAIEAMFRPRKVGPHGRVHGGRILWAEVMELLCCGSTRAKVACEIIGLDPDQYVVKR